MMTNEVKSKFNQLDLAIANVMKWVDKITRKQKEMDEKIEALFKEPQQPAKHLDKPKAHG